MTLGNYIRSMDDEKLAEFLVGITGRIYKEHNLIAMISGLPPIEFDYEMEKKTMMESLQKEIE